MHEDKLMFCFKFIYHYLTAVSQSIFHADVPLNFFYLFHFFKICTLQKKEKGNGKQFFF